MYEENDMTGWVILATYLEEENAGRMKNALEEAGIPVRRRDEPWKKGRPRQIVLWVPHERHDDADLIGVDEEE